MSGYWLFVRNSIKAHKGTGYLLNGKVVKADKYTEFDEKKPTYKWVNESKGAYMQYSTKEGDANYTRHSFSVEPHPYSEKHLLLKVTAKGRVYACVSAWEPGGFLEDEPKPTTSTVQYLWRHDRKLFLPYNESTGTFC